MRTLGAFEAKTHLSKLLDQVAAGEEITITRHGEPVAKLVPIASADKRADLRVTIAAIRALGKKHKLRGIAIGDLVNAGRKY